MTQTQIPPVEMVNRLERAYSKIFFFLLAEITISANLKLIHLVLIWNETKGLQIAKVWNFGKTETPWGVLNGPKMISGHHLLLFSVINAKNINIITVKYSQNYFEINFGWTHFLPKNSKLKLVFKEAEKEPRKASFPWDLGMILGKPIWSN